MYIAFVYGSFHLTERHKQLNINPTQINKMMSGAQNVDPKTMGMGMTFMHETLHSTVGGGLRDAPVGSGLGPTGAVVNRMNIVNEL